MIPLLAAEIDNNTLLGAGAVSILGIFLFLLKFHAALKGYIHDVNNQKPEGREILGQPIRFTQEDKPLTEKSHASMCGELHRRVDVVEKDILVIRGKMESDKTEIISAGEERAVKIHDRVNVAIEKIGELKGQVTEIAKRVQ